MAVRREPGLCFWAWLLALTRASGIPIHICVESVFRIFCPEIFLPEVFVSRRVRIVFHNWKDMSKEYTVEGVIVPYSKNPASERLVIKSDDDQYMDIIKETIISITHLSNESKT